MKNISRRNKLYIRGTLVLVLFALWLCVPEVKSYLSGMVMLFTQRSVQSLQGNINTSVMPVLTALKQSAFHSAAMFFLPPRQIVAAAACLGTVKGTAVSLAGSLIGASVWYWLLSPVLKSHVLDGRASALSAGITAGITGLLGGVWGPVMGLCAMLKLPFLRCVIGLAAAEIVVTLMYAMLCSPFSALLPSWAALCLRICGGTILALCIWRLSKK